MTETKTYPFIYIYNGKPQDIYSFQGEKYFIFFFKDSVDENIEKKIEKAAPLLLRESFLWAGNMMLNYSCTDEDEIIMHYMKNREESFDTEMDDELMMQIYTDFANDIEGWALKVNEITPIDFFIGNPAIAGSEWDNYSNSLFENVILRIEEESNELNPRKKQIINTALKQIREGRSASLSKESMAKTDNLIGLTE